MVETEKYSTRNNILIFRLREDDGETSSRLKETVVKEIFSHKLEVRATAIEQIHRIGQKKTGHMTSNYEIHGL